MMHVGGSGLECESRATVARASLMAIKAAVVASFHATALVESLAAESSPLSDWRVSAQCGRKRW